MKSIDALTPESVQVLRALLTSLEGILSSAPPAAPANRATIHEVGNELLISKARSGRSIRYLEQVHVRLSNLFRDRMTTPVHTVTPTQIEAWIHERGGKGRTLRNYWADAKLFFNFAQRRGYCATNPASQIELPRLLPSKIGIHTPSEVAKVMHLAQVRFPDLVPILALKYFGGLRTSEAFAIREDQIGAKYVEVDATQAKTRRRRLVSRNPTLDAWLKLPRSSPLPLVNASEQMALLRRCADVPWPHNVARHSFCSYHLAKYCNAAKTALEAGHTEAILFRHYRELVTEDSADAYWTILPTPAERLPSGIRLVA